LWTTTDLSRVGLSFFLKATDAAVAAAAVSAAVADVAAV
jgi:hypothetical protein